MLDSNNLSNMDESGRRCIENAFSFLKTLQRQRGTTAETNKLVD